MSAFRENAHPYSSMVRRAHAIPWAAREFWQGGLHFASLIGLPTLRALKFGLTNAPAREAGAEQLEHHQPDSRGRQ